MSSYRSFLPHVLPIVAFIFIFGFLSRSQTTVVLDAVQDTYVRNNAPTNNYGGSTTISVGTFRRLIIGGGYVTYFTRSFIEFDFSSIPSNAIIESATLKLKKGISRFGDASFVIRRLTTSWDEDSVTFTDQPDISTMGYDEYTSYTFSNDTMLFDLTDLTQRMVYGSVPNYGWSIQVTDENQTVNTGGSFYSSESTYMPVLEVTYSLPMIVSNCTINHESFPGANDGSILPSLKGGPCGNFGNYGYEWIDGSTGNTIGTTLNLEGVGAGWYGLHVWCNHGPEFYMAFLVGTLCSQTEITFRPGKNYIQGALLRHGNLYGLITDDMAFGLTSNIECFDSPSDLFAKYLYQFYVWLDPNITYSQADMTLIGNQHNNTVDNSGNIQMITQEWNGNYATWNITPTSNSGSLIDIAATSSPAENAVLDILSYINSWKTDNSTNYGFIAQLDYYGTGNHEGLSYYGSSMYPSVNSPKINFTLDLSQNNCNPYYAELKRELDGGYTVARLGELKFTFDEEYTTSKDYLDFKIYNTSRSVVASCDNSGNVTGIASPEAYQQDDGRYTLQLSLTDGEFYVLELRTAKGDKRYLKFLFTN